MVDFPNAKINIGLFVTERRQDGYHNLETIIFPVPGLCDALEVVEADSFSFTVSGLVIPGNPAENIVTKAYNLLKADFNLPEFAIHLHKKIPFGAGLGGGSSDGAFMLRMLNFGFHLGLNLDELKDYARKLGADCPFFIENIPAFATGTGEILKPVSVDLSGYETIIIKPPFNISTSGAYSSVKPGKAGCYLPEVVTRPPEFWQKDVYNDFENHLFLKYPELKMLKSLLYTEGAKYASMSGSGSSIYGIFETIPAGIEQKLPPGCFFYR